jgi:hypothetical protein
MRKVSQRIDALLLVGGFSGSGYLFKKVEVSGVPMRSTMRLLEDVLNVIDVFRISLVNE